MNALTVAPIDNQRRNAVILRTASLIEHASRLFLVDLEKIPVLFDLKGRAAGMFCADPRQIRIRYNPWIFAKYYEDNMSQTVPHEVAHYVVERLFGRRGIKPHGREWQNVMIALGYSPQVTCQYDLAGIPIRNSKKFKYFCQCAEHSLGSVRHNRISQGKAHYTCRKCGSPLSFGKLSTEKHFG